MEDSAVSVAIALLLSTQGTNHKYTQGYKPGVTLLELMGY